MAAVVCDAYAREGGHGEPAAVEVVRSAAAPPPAKASGAKSKGIPTDDPDAATLRLLSDDEVRPTLPPAHRRPASARGGQFESSSSSVSP